MAPERWSRAAVDGRTDLYALGCVLFELCTGQPPFRSTDWQEVAQLHRSVPPPVPSALRPGLPGGLDALLAELLAKDPAGRPAQAGEVERRLREPAAADPRGPEVAGAGAAGAGAGAAGPGAADAGAAGPGAADAGAAGPGAVVAPAAPEPEPEPAPGTGSTPVLPVPVASLRRPWRRGVLAGAGAALVAAIALAAWQLTPLKGTGNRAAGGPGSSAAAAPASSASPSPSPSAGTTASVSASAQVSPSAPPSASAAAPPSAPAPAGSGGPAPAPSATARTTPASPPPVQAPALPTGWFRFTNAATGMCLSVPDASTSAAMGLVQERCGGGNEQFWQLRAEGQGAYSVRNANSGQCLSVDAARKENGVVITQYICGLYPDQYWTLRFDAAYRGWQLVSRNSGRCVSIRAGGGNREQALQWDCTATAELSWRT
ncbi:RICIN domain-containing protein [Streptomyces sp. NPDC048340]|uniref:RICIN domain-containing protein n=1 Tax=Streptomyces sp. NPDC048340 TaxID=3365537 RepID=UPI003715B616